jgi:hypothetical protein
MAKRKRARRDWRAVVQGQATSGKSVVAYCRDQGVSASQFYRWRKAYGGQAVASGERGFVELTPVDEPSPHSGVAVITAYGWRLEVEPGFDVSTLERVLACVMRSGPCSP